MNPTSIGDVRCPFCLTEFENEEGGASASDRLADHVSSEHDVYNRALKIGLAGGT